MLHECFEMGFFCKGNVNGNILRNTHTLENTACSDGGLDVNRNRVAFVSCLFEGDFLTVDFVTAWCQSLHVCPTVQRKVSCQKSVAKLTDGARR